MLRPRTVWMVRLERGGDLREVEGTLRISEDAVVFDDPATARQTRIPFASARRVKRVVGSPVLVLRWVTDAGERAETAFYFVRPPPTPGMDHPGAHGIETHEPTSLLRQPSRRRQRRENVSYLTTRSSDTKTIVQAWTKEVRSRIRC